MHLRVIVTLIISQRMQKSIEKALARVTRARAFLLGGCLFRQGLSRSGSRLLAACIVGHDAVKLILLLVRALNVGNDAVLAQNFHALAKRGSVWYNEVTSLLGG